MDELIKVLEKDVWDYVGIFAPIILSFVAIVISMWNSFWSKNVKKLESNMDIYYLIMHIMNKDLQLVYPHHLKQCIIVLQISQNQENVILERLR